MSVGEMLAATVPMARTLRLEFLETSPEKAVVALPDQSEYHNHVGGPHAGAMFTLGESASGAVVLAAFGDQLSRAVPLAVGAEIAYRKLAMGEVTATATLEQARGRGRRGARRRPPSRVPGLRRAAARGRRRHRRDDGGVDPASQRLTLRPGRLRTAGSGWGSRPGRYGRSGRADGGRWRRCGSCTRRG